MVRLTLQREVPVTTLYRQCPPAPMAAFARGEGMTLADVHETLTKETPWATT